MNEEISREELLERGEKLLENIKELLKENEEETEKLISERERLLKLKRIVKNSHQVLIDSEFLEGL